MCLPKSESLPTLVQEQQVMRDWLPLASKRGDAAMRLRNLNMAQKRTLKDIQHFFADEVTVHAGGEGEEGESLEDVLAFERKSNIEWLERFDSTLKLSTGHGVQAFAPLDALRPLKEGERRELRDVEGAQAAVSKRSFIVEGDSARLEISAVAVQGEGIVNRLHMVSDMGSVGQPGAWFLVAGNVISGSFTWDLLHRLQSGVQEATKEAGLTILRLGYLQVLKMRKGPFSVGGANFWTLKGCAMELFRTVPWDNVLAQAIYPYVADGMPEAVDYGSPRHMQDAWKYAEYMLVNKSTCEAAKSGRWWSFEERSRASLCRRGCDLLVLIFLGFKRGWWRTMSRCPLFCVEGAHGDDLEQAIPGEEEAGDGRADEGGEAGGEEGNGVEAGPNMEITHTNT